ncbi:hypothetical protein BVX98_07000 [bacterium F11]|nr:hypothetical protein BVX98_07000 [bacterium F11]
MICAQFDIKPDTLRKWEKRKRIPLSKRKENGYRFYTDEDMSKIGEFLKRQYWTRDGDLHKKSQTQKPKSLKINHHQLSHDSTINAIEYFNKPKLRGYFDQIVTKEGPILGFQNHWVPILTKIGELAMAEKGLWIAREHFASTHIREWTLQHFKDSDQRGKEQLIMTTPEGDMHELGMLFAMCQIRLHKINCLYLGPNLPLKSLLQAMQETKIKNISLTLNKSLSRQNLKKILSSIRKVNSSATVFVAGPASFPLANLIKELGAIFIGTNLEIGIQKIKAHI